MKKKKKKAAILLNQSWLHQDPYPARGGGAGLCRLQVPDKHVLSRETLRRVPKAPAGSCLHKQDSLGALLCRVLHSQEISVPGRTVYLCPRSRLWCLTERAQPLARRPNAGSALNLFLFIFDNSSRPCRLPGIISRLCSRIKYIPQIP